MSFFVGANSVKARKKARKSEQIQSLPPDYLAEQIVVKRNNERLDAFLNSLCQLDSATVKRIEGLTPQDCDNGKIMDIILEFEKSLSDEKRAKCFVPDMSDKRFYENVEYFKKLAEVLKTAKSAKKTRKLATGKSNKIIEDCTADDVK